MQWKKMKTDPLSNHTAITAASQQGFVRIAEKKNLLVSLGTGRWTKAKTDKSGTSRGVKNADELDLKRTQKKTAGCDKQPAVFLSLTTPLLAIR